MKECRLLRSQEQRAKFVAMRGKQEQGAYILDGSASAAPPKKEVFT